MKVYRESDNKNISENQSHKVSILFKIMNLVHLVFQNFMSLYNVTACLPLILWKRFLLYFLILNLGETSWLGLGAP